MRGPSGIEPESRAPKARILPLYYGPIILIYFILNINKSIYLSILLDLNQ